MNGEILGTFTNRLSPFTSEVSVAQLDRASDFGSEGWGFESLQARGLIGNDYLCLAQIQTRLAPYLDQVLFCSLRGRSSSGVFLSGDLKPDSRERLCSWQLFSKIKSQ